jgi:RWD domain
MNDDQRLDELEALEAIYMGENELSVTCRDASQPICLLVTTLPFQYDENENNVGAKLDFALPCDYPDQERPAVVVRQERGLSQPQLAEIKELVDQVVEEAMGSGPMVFTVVEAVRQWLIEHNETSLVAARKAQEQKEADEEARKEASAASSDAAIAKLYQSTAPGYSVADGEGVDAVIDEDDVDPQDEQGNALGTIVDKHSFAQWWQKFVAEMAEKGTPVLVERRQQEYTGRSLFEQGKLNAKTGESEE